MPIYEYHCQSCGQQFEMLVMQRDETMYCPACNSERLQKLISAHTVGSGMPDTPCGAPPCSAGACPSCE
ncbi:MAG: zinc ribbon domain-containing protein [Mariprofundaceae bacterium]|nr:zinc ribbon domain-containing protein [Mariprofundaceae bacterium]